MKQPEIIKLAEYSRFRGLFALTGPALIIAFRFAIGVFVVLMNGEYTRGNSPPEVNYFALVMLGIVIIWWYWITWGGICRSLFGPKTAVYIVEGKIHFPNDFSIKTDMIDKFASRESLRGPYVDIHYDKDKTFSINCILLKHKSEELIRNIEKYLPKTTIENRSHTDIALN